jgi:prefoldin subunit 5
MNDHAEAIALLEAKLAEYEPQIETVREEIASHEQQLRDLRQTLDFLVKAEGKLSSSLMKMRLIAAQSDT